MWDITTVCVEIFIFPYLAQSTRQAIMQDPEARSFCRESAYSPLTIRLQERFIE
jgi:hypothetical protein